MLTDRRLTHPWGRLCLPGALLAMLLAAAGPAQASGSLHAERARAAGVMAQLDLLQTRRAAALDRERAAQLQLSDARAQLAASRVEIAAASLSLDRSRAALAESLVSAYKSTGQDAMSYVLASGSFSDLVSRVDLLRRSQRGDRDLIAQITRTQRRLAQQQRLQQQAAAGAAAALADARQARGQLDAAIARGRAVLARTSADIRTLLAQERSRRAALAHGDGGGGGGGGGTGVGGSGTGGGGGGGSGGSSGNVFYGECTWYGPGFAGQRTASGEIFDPNALTAASPWLPFGTQLEVTNLATGLSVQVRVNDRGPFGRGVLDLSAHAARVVQLSGWQRVRIQILSGSPSAAAAVMP